MRNQNREQSIVRGAAGYTIAELMIILAVLGVVASMAVPASNQMFAGQHLRDSADTLNRAFSYAREEAIRSGNIQIVFIGKDAQGNALKDANGDEVDVLILNDGRPGGSLQNCKIDGGEQTTALSLEIDVSFGLEAAGGAVASDGGSGDRETGSTFSDASGNQARWVMFRPEGVPVSFSSDCSTGEIGEGAGAVYLTNGERDAAVVLTPLGSSRVHIHRPDADTWSS